MVHDYHLYTLPAARARGAPGRLPAPLRPHPVDAARRLARAAHAHPRRDLRGRARQRHRRLPHALVPLELPAVLPRPARPRRRLRARHRPPRRAARRGSAPTRCRSTTRRRSKVARSERTQEFEAGAASAAGATTSSCASTAPTCPRTSCAASRAFDQFLEQHPEFRREGDVHRAAHAVADGRPRVPRVPRAHRGARRGRQPPPRHAGLDADPAQAARRPRGGGRRLQALRRDDRQRDVRRHEPRRQGGAARQRAPRRLDPVGEHRRARGARRVRAERQPVRHQGDGGLDPRAR